MIFWKLVLCDMLYMSIYSLETLSVLWNYFCLPLQTWYSLHADVEECSGHSGLQGMNLGCRAELATWLQISALQEQRSFCLRIHSQGTLSKFSITFAFLA